MSIEPSPREQKRAKLSVNVSAGVSDHLRNLAYKHRLSESSIVEVALKTLFVGGDDEQLGVVLRQNGATLRSR
ncbi:MAG TPA: hypothetical protein VKF82_12465 [Candidatus Eremiobacteraceae bacterium]|nr:hypothetical protein [Candidatus Eremiobacteraceae bacterium]